MSDRTVLRISGDDRVAFLQNLVTNDVEGLTGEALTYAALLTPQGKFLADFFMSAAEDTILVDVAASHAAGLAQRLGMYKLRAAVEIAESELKVAYGTGLADPRHDSLPARSYGDVKNTFDPMAERVAACVPETGLELTPDSYILESGFERLNGVDFRKGCYVGQEVTARMKHKTELRKGLVTVQVDGHAPIGTEITRDGRAIGTLFSQSNGHGIAHLRFDKAGDGMIAGDAQVAF